MLTFALVAALAQFPQHRLFLQPNLPRVDYAFAEFAPASAAGMSSTCACTAVTGAKGEVLTATRASNGTCSPLGVATTGITNASLVECASNQPRIEAQSDGTRALRSETSKTNVLTRFIDYTNAVWADVGTPTPTTGQTSPWTGTYASSAVLYDDNDAVAFEGRAQTVTVTAAAQYSLCCFVKGGTLTKARLSLDGTTADYAALSTTTWTLAKVTDASSSGVAISAQVLNGTVVGDTGTVIWGGCQVEPGGFCSSMIPTVAGTVTRGADTPSMAVVDLSNTTICIAASLEPLWGSTNFTQFAAAVEPSWGGPNSLLQATSALYDARMFGTAFPARALVPGLVRLIGFESASTVSISVNGTATTTAPGVASDRFGATLRIGYGLSGNQLDGLISRVQVDPNPTRCTP